VGSNTNRQGDYRRVEKLVANLIEREGLTPPPAYELRGEILREVDTDKRLEESAEIAIRYACALIQRTWTKQTAESKLPDAYREQPVEPHYYRTRPGLNKSLIGDFESYD
jgi:hypothetical protein